MVAGVAVQALCVHDFPRIVALAEESASSGDVFGYEQRTVREWLQNGSGLLLGAFGIAKRDLVGVCLGLIDVPTRDVGVTVLYVSPRARRCGVGSALLGGAVARAHACGCNRVWLHTRVVDVEVRRFMGTKGFVENGTYTYHEIRLALGGDEERSAFA